MERTGAFAQIAKDIAALDAAKGQGMVGAAQPLQNPALAPMQQKNFIQGQPSMMGGRPRPAQAPRGMGAPPPANPVPQGGMPPAYRQRPQRGTPITTANMGEMRNPQALQEYKEANAPIRLASGNERQYQGTRRAMEIEAAAQEQQRLAFQQKTKEVAKMAFDQSLSAGMPPAQAQGLADRIIEFPQKAPEILKQISDFRENRLKRSEDRTDASTLYEREVAENMRQEGVVDTRDQEQRNRRYEGLIRNGVPDNLAKAFAQNPEDNQVEVLKFLHDRAKDLGDMDQAEFLARQTKTKAYQEMDNTIKQIENTFEASQGIGALGLASWLTNKIPETPAYNTLASIDTQKAKNAFKALFDMRQASTTGGALGNVSNREIELLYSEFAALDPKMGDQFVSNLADVLQRFEAMKYMLQNERRFEQEKFTAEEMYEESTKAVNRRTARKMTNKNNSKGTPQAALEAYYAGDVSKAAFKKEYGWTPISTVQDWETETELKGVYER